MIRLQSFSSLAMLLLLPSFAIAQQANHDAKPDPSALQQQVEKLVAMLSQEESTLKESQRRISELREQVVALRADLARFQPDATATPSDVEAQDAAQRLNSQLSALREQQDLEQSEIAIHEQTKVESASRFPLKLTGLILVNAFANSSTVDVIQSPSVAGKGSGTEGISWRQSVLGLDARGPHVIGASSSASIRVDFFGNPGQGAYANGGGTVRLRTAHAELAWKAARTFFEMDRPLLNPNTPTSLASVAQPPLAWSGNLWTWVPQAGAEYSVAVIGASHVVIQGALADIPDPPSFRASVSSVPSASLSEQSRRPGVEGRISITRGDKASGLQVGLGGYFSPHRQGNEFHFNAWAGSIDFRVPLSKYLELSGNTFRGSALGGLGAGAFKDYVYRHVGGEDAYSALDDIGGWTQLKARLGERMELNAAYGLDNAFVGEIRPYLTIGSGFYQNLARNSTFLSNVVYSPTAYTLFSAEYRRIDSSLAVGAPANANVYGVAAGYRF